MEENTDNNKIIDNNSEEEDIEFQFNFINAPWDDRTPKSKTCIIILLVFIFLATIALVIHNFCMHFKGYDPLKRSKNNEISCYRIRVDELPYVARLHSAISSELLCLGAIVSPTSVLANGLCVRSGQLKMYIGSMSNPRCKKGFSVDVSESIYHPAVVTNKLVLLSSYDNIEECSDAISIGHQLDWDSQVHVIGRPFAHGRVLSRQHITLAGRDLGKHNNIKKIKTNKNYTIVCKGLSRCPVRPGDIMLQNGKLFGLAVYQRSKLAFFADLDPVKRELMEIDADIVIDNYTTRRRIYRLHA